MSVNMQIGDLVTCRLEYLDQNGTVAFNNLWYQIRALNWVGIGPPPLPARVDSFRLFSAMAAPLFTAMANTWKLAASEQVAMTGLTLQSPFPAPRSAQFHYIPPATQGGDQAGDAMPLQDSPTIVKRTAIGARNGIGRLFYVGISEANCNAGLMEPAAITDMNTFAAAIASERVVTIPDDFQVTLFPVLVGGIGTSWTILDIIGAAVSDPVIKTQRRRRPGKGI